MRSLYTAMCGTEKIYPIPKVPPLVIHTPVDNSAASPSPIEDTVLRAATCRYATLCPFPRIAPRVQAVATLVVDEDRGVAGEHIVRVDVGDGRVVDRGASPRKRRRTSALPPSGTGIAATLIRSSAHYGYSIRRIFDNCELTYYTSKSEGNTKCSSPRLKSRHASDGLPLAGNASIATRSDRSTRRSPDFVILTSRTTSGDDRVALTIRSATTSKAVTDSFSGSRPMESVMTSREGRTSLDPTKIRPPLVSLKGHCAWIAYSLPVGEAPVSDSTQATSAPKENTPIFRALPMPDRPRPIIDRISSAASDIQYAPLLKRPTASSTIW